MFWQAWIPYSHLFTLLFSFYLIFELLPVFLSSISVSPLVLVSQSNDLYECTPLHLHYWQNEWVLSCSLMIYNRKCSLIDAFYLLKKIKQETKRRIFTINPLFPFANMYVKPTLFYNEHFDGCRAASLEPDKAAVAWKQKVTEPSTSSRSQNRVNNLNW